MSIIPYRNSHLLNVCAPFVPRRRAPLYLATTRTGSPWASHSVQPTPAAPLPIAIDKLHPLPGEKDPHVEYRDVGFWRNRIDFKPDDSMPAFRARLRAILSTPFASKDALCAAEIERRFKAAPTHMGTASKSTPKQQVAFSACNRPDLVSHPVVESPFLREGLGLRDDRVLQTTHRFAKNSPLNGQSYWEDGKVVYLDNAIASTSDRTVEGTGNLRVVRSHDGRSICYAGRVETVRKALEQASFIFFQELHSTGRGITRTVDEKGQPVYQLDYLVNSFLSSPWFMRKETTMFPFPEREFTEMEVIALEAIRQKGFILMIDPNDPTKTYRVCLNPMLFSRSFNFILNLEAFMPSFVTGESRAKEISETGYDELFKLADRQIDALRAEASPESVTKIQEIARACNSLKQHMQKKTLQSEEELVIRMYLCQLLNLPAVHHCKSSLDRTSIAVALSSALQQWLDLRLPIPDPIETLVQDWRFKELFTANWMVGHQITRFCRGCPGTVDGKKFDNDDNLLGLTMERGLSQNPVIQRLLPSRYLTSSPWYLMPICYAILAIPTFSLGLAMALTSALPRNCAYIAISTYMGLVATTQWAAPELGKRFPKLQQRKEWLGPLRFFAPILPLTMLLRFPALFPTHMLNEDSPLVGARSLIDENPMKQMFRHGFKI